VCIILKLFLITTVEDSGDDQLQETPPVEEDPGEFFLEEFLEISLNTITGTPSPKTMRIVGF